MNMVAVTPRKAFLGIFVIAALMMGYALFAEHVQGYQPCMLCMVQRVFVCHVYLQSLSPEELDGCAPSFEYALENYDALKFLKTIFIRDQDCGVIDWTFLGFSMPAWVLAGFVALFAASLWTGFRRS